MRELPGQAGHVAEVLVDGKIQVFEIQQTEVHRNKAYGTLDCVEKVVGMEECESDYSVVHLGPETQGLPAFHRIVGEDEVTSPFLASLCLVKGNAVAFLILMPFTDGDEAVLQP